MKFYKITAIISGIMVSTAYFHNAYAAPLVLDGKSLTIEDVVSVAENPTISVEVTKDAQQRLTDGFDLVMNAAKDGVAVYGLTVGVGWNKDRPAFQTENGVRVIDEQLLAASRAFNLDQLRAHAAGFGEPMDREIVRAAMIIRLNQMLTGMTGIQPDVAEMYRNFLNNDIVPVVPSIGSLGQADITLAAHIGLAMIGEWQVEYKGKVVSAADALADANLSPIKPVGKDFLSIISSNALTVGHAALLSHETENYLSTLAVTFALSLEGFNGNVTPFLEETTAVRPFEGMNIAAKMIRSALEGSYLWEPSEVRGLQDPLSYRTMAYSIGSAVEASNSLKSALTIHINHTDDNPVTRAEHQYKGTSKQVMTYQLPGGAGAIYPTANFELLPVADKVEALNIALARIARTSSMQIIRYENPELTRLPRFLAAKSNNGLAFGALQVPLTALVAQARQYSLPVSLDNFSTSAGIEDTASNAPLAIDNLNKLLDINYKVTSMSLLHAAQAVELRGDIAIGKKTGELLKKYREKVFFVDQDRSFTPDLVVGEALIRAWKL